MLSLRPGRPQPVLQAVCTGRLGPRVLIAYISGTILNILDEPNHVLQAIRVTEDEELQAVAFDDRTGCSAVASRGRTYVYGPSDDETFTSIRWTLRAEIDHGEKYHETISLSWGADLELLVARSDLYLYSTAQSSTPISTIPLPNPAKLAAISPDSTYIACSGAYDRFVKVLRRLSFDTRELRFDRTYLAHPQLVTDLRWKQASQADQRCVLYTFCADGVSRIWAAADHHHDLAFQILPLCGQIDLRGVISSRPAGGAAEGGDRLAFLVNSQDFNETLATSLGLLDPEHPSRAFYEDLLGKKADVCLVIDRDGHLSAWGIVMADGRSVHQVKPFSICHVKNTGLKFDEDQRSGYIRPLAVTSGRDGQLNIILHELAGGISWYTGSLTEILDPVPRGDRFTEGSQLDGHRAPVRQMRFAEEGEQLISWDVSGDIIIWKKDEGRGIRYVPQALLELSDEVVDVVLLHESSHLAILLPSSIAIWSLNISKPEEVSRTSFQPGISPRLMIRLPPVGQDLESLAFVIVTQQNTAMTVKMASLSKEEKRRSKIDHAPSQLDLGMPDQLQGLESCPGQLNQDPSSKPTSAYLFGGTSSGSLALWQINTPPGESQPSAKIDEAIEADIVHWDLATCSSQLKVAAVDHRGLRLTIWDLLTGSLELVRSVSGQQAVEDAQWSGPLQSGSLLALRSVRNITVLSQTRLTEEPDSCWMEIYGFDVRDITADPLSDLKWLGAGRLAVSAGQQLVFLDPRVAVGGHALEEVPAAMAADLPVFHPRFLKYCVFEGHLQFVGKVLIALREMLKFYTEGDDLDPWLGLDPDDLMSSPTEDELQEFDEHDEASVDSIVQNLHDKKLRPYLSCADQLSLANLIEDLAEILSRRNVLDPPAQRFLLSFRQCCRLKPSTPPPAAPQISYREVCWAHQSSSQEALLALILAHYYQRLTWPAAQASTIFLWLHSPAILRTHFESLARTLYSSSPEKSPTACSLHYLALRQKPLLLTLWKRTYGAPEQVSTVKLLSNDFSLPRNQTIAKKNAYALLSRHRPQYAAAFFLLAEDLCAATSVCCAQLGDAQLAIAVARVHSGDVRGGNAALAGVLGDRLLPAAAKNGDRWAASWLLGMLGRVELALKAASVAPCNLLDVDVTTELEARGMEREDPLLLGRWRHLRGRRGKGGQMKYTEVLQMEYKLVRRTVRAYCRMGMPLLALAVARDWKFVTREMWQVPAQRNAEVQQAGSTEGTEQEYEQPLFSPRMPVTPKTPDVKRAMEKSSRGRSPRKSNGRPSEFEEPEANSLLDAFGF